MQLTRPGNESGVAGADEASASSEGLAAAVGEERDTIEDVYEPYLIQQGFMMRTPRGRVATERAYRHFGMKPVSEINPGGSAQIDSD